MDSAEFRRCGKQLIDFIADYLENLHDREVLPNVRPNYLREHLPVSPPEQPEPWEDVMSDVEKYILKGVTHWLHPKFNGYFPIGISYASILGDILSTAFGVGFTWRANPAITELERIVLDWLARMTGMPEHFLNESNIGGGSLQGSASDCVLVSMLAARKDKLAQLVEQAPDTEETVHLPRLVAYCSQLGHSCISKAAHIACVRLRRLPYDTEDMALRCDEFAKVVLDDKRQGLVPFYVCAVLGTTACASCDNLSDIGQICQREGIWCHVDAAYAGSAFVCTEYRRFLKGIELVDSFNFNASKWLLCTFDTSILWVKSKVKLLNAMTSDPTVSAGGVPSRFQSIEENCDLKDWGIPLSRRFRALKPWFVIRLYGVERLRRHIREHCRLAQLFRTQLLTDERFNVVAKTHFSLVCFRFRNSDALSQLLVCRINKSRDLHLMPASICDRYAIRFAIVRERATEADIEQAVAAIRRHGDSVDGETRSVILNANLVDVQEKDEQASMEANYTSDDLIVGLSAEQIDRKLESIVQSYRLEENTE